MKKKLSRLLFGIVLFSFCFGLNVKSENPDHGNSTDAVLSGKITDSEGKSVPYINVYVKNTTLGTVTDASGYYYFKKLPKGNLIISVEGLGYKPQEKKVRIEGSRKLNLDYEMESDALNLSEIVVTSGRSSEKRSDAPVIVNTLGGKTFQVTQSHVLGEALNFTPGLRYEDNCQNCGFSQVRINGMGGAYSQILINSRPVFSGLAGVYGLELIPTNMIQRIEVVRGGGSSLYGSNAIAGTINLILKDPTTNSFEAGLNTDLVGMGVKGSDGPEPDNTVTFNTSIVTDDHNAGMSIYGNVRARNFFDYNNDGFSEIPPMRNTVVGMRMFYRPNDRGKLSLDFFNIREQRDGGSDQGEPMHERRIAEALRHDMKNMDLTYSQFFRESDELSVYASGQYLDRESYYGANQSLKDYGHTVDQTYNIGAQYKANFKNSSLTAGLDNKGDYLVDKKLGYPEYSVGHTTGALGLDSTYVAVTHVPATTITNQALQTLGLFAQYEIKWQNLKVLAGGRIERYSVSDRQGKSADKSGNVFVLRADIMYDFTPYLQLRAGYSRGYRAPQVFDEDLHTSVSGARKVTILNSPDLKQENSNSYTVSLDFNKMIGTVYTGLTVEGFYTKLENPFVNNIGTPDASGNVIYTRVNSTNGGTVKGFNIEFKLRPITPLMFSSGFTVQSSKYQSVQNTFSNRSLDRKDFYRTPNAYGYFTLDYSFLKNFGFSATGDYTGRMYVPHYYVPDANTPDNIVESLTHSHPFFDAGCKFYYNMKLKSLNVQWYAGIKNIFNSYQSDFDMGIARDPNYIYGPAEPRTVSIGFRIGNIL